MNRDITSLRKKIQDYMEVIKMRKKMPQLIRGFTDLLWASFQTDWTVKFLYTQEILFVSILIPEEGSLKKIRRQYTKETIEKRQKDLWGLATDCSEEISNSILKADS